MGPSSRPPRTSSRLSDAARQRFAAVAAMTLVFTLLLWSVTLPVAQAQTFSTLYSFGGPPDGAAPYGAVIRDRAGNLYGTTYEGGYLSCKDAYHPYGCGVVFELSADGSETVLHRLTGGTTDGEFPFAPLLRDESGDLYGTAGAGGTGNCSTSWGELGCGVVFKIDAAGNETVLYNFRGGTKDGCYPEQGLVMDEYGNLYGTTGACGSSNNGTVFTISKNGREVLLHSFTGGDGGGPYYGHLLMDTNGDLYGVTSGQSQTESCGTLYKLTRKGKLTVLHIFGGGWDGCFPMGTPAMDRSGSLYGTTAEGGGWPDSGTVWKVSRSRVETVWHTFTAGSEGFYPEAGVVLDSKGNVYGNTGAGGDYAGGTLWKVSKNGRFEVLHSFAQGSWVMGEVLRDSKGVLYGTTTGSGTYGYGTVWSYNRCGRSSTNDLLAP